MKRIWFSCLLAVAAGVIAATAHAQYSALRDYEITLDVDDEPGRVADERYEVDEKYQRRVVFYRTTEPVGTIIVETRERMLYLVLPDNRAMRYGIGVGRDGFRWKGLQKIARKAEWPDWRPPAEMIERQPYLPRFMAGGAGNPLGARAMYLGNTVYRIHGTNQPHTIGHAVSSGCFRLVNADVIDLYERVPVGTRVVVQP
ncbi:MAG TPA: L,D-transpeptidase [Xanthobacteraceae bacterium]|nr:L,D-transpeptidase [Xanthobacteraceae bacterium]